MGKDRDISRTISTPKKVGFVGSAFLAGTAAIMAACGGGSKAGTGEVGGAQSNPTTGQTIEVKTAALPSATAVQEAPTATAVPTEVMTPDELKAAGAEVNGTFAKAFDNFNVSSVGFDKVSQPSERSLASIQSAIRICTGVDPIPYQDDAQRQRSEQDPTLMLDSLSGYCEQAGEASLGFYNALGNDSARQALFQQANMEVEKIHYSVIKTFQAKDSRIKDAFWLMEKRRFYPFNATGTAAN